MAEQITYQLIRVLHIEGKQTPFSCHRCGEALKNVFFLRGSNDREITVGSECVRILLSGADLKAAQDADKNLKQASREWRKQQPPALPGESREAYINRRLLEIPNAARARREMMAIRNPYMEAKRRLEQAGLADPMLVGYGGMRHYQDDFETHADWNVRKPHAGRRHECWLCQQQEAICRAYEREVHAEQFRSIQEIAARYGANIHDLTNVDHFQRLINP